MALASDVVAKARKTLQDYDSDRWADADLLSFLNGGRRQYAIADPTAYSKSAVQDLVDRAEQQCPADCNVFYEVQASVDKVTGKDRNAVTVTQREYVDTFVPGWRSMKAAETQHFMFGERLPTEFLVYPPAKAGDKVRLKYSANPADLALGDSLSSPESLQFEALADYTVARALLEDAESPANQQRAVMHLQLFSAATGADLSSLLKNSPNAANVGGRNPKVVTGQ